MWNLLICFVTIMRKFAFRKLSNDTKKSFEKVLEKEYVKEEDSTAESMETTSCDEQSLDSDANDNIEEKSSTSSETSDDEISDEENGKNQCRCRESAEGNENEVSGDECSENIDETEADELGDEDERDVTNENYDNDEYVGEGIDEDELCEDENITCESRSDSISDDDEVHESSNGSLEQSLAETMAHADAENIEKCLCVEGDLISDYENGSQRSIDKNCGVCTMNISDTFCNELDVNECIEGKLEEQSTLLGSDDFNEISFASEHDVEPVRRIEKGAFFDEVLADYGIVKPIAGLTIKQMNWLKHGHGIYCEAYDEGAFFSMSRRSSNMVVHFYKTNNIGCDFIDKHLKTLAPKHIEARFCRLLLSEAPFLAKRLKINVTPTILLIKKRICREILYSFQEFRCVDELSAEWLEWRIAISGTIRYEGDVHVVPANNIPTKNTKNFHMIYDKKKHDVNPDKNEDVEYELSDSMIIDDSDSDDESFTDVYVGCNMSWDICELRDSGTSRTNIIDPLDMTIVSNRSHERGCNCGQERGCCGERRAAYDMNFSRKSRNKNKNICLYK